LQEGGLVRRSPSRLFGFDLNWYYAPWPVNFWRKLLRSIVFMVGSTPFPFHLPLCDWRRGSSEGWERRRRFPPHKKTSGARPYPSRLGSLKEWRSTATRVPSNPSVWMIWFRNGTKASTIFLSLNFGSSGNGGLGHPFQPRVTCFRRPLLEQTAERRSTSPNLSRTLKVSRSPCWGKNLPKRVLSVEGGRSFSKVQNPSSSALTRFRLAGANVGLIYGSLPAVEWYLLLFG